MSENGENGKDLVAFQKMSADEKFLYFFGENTRTRSDLRDIKKGMRFLPILYGSLSGTVPVGGWMIYEKIAAKPSIILPLFADIITWVGLFT